MVSALSVRRSLQNGSPRCREKKWRAVFRRRRYSERAVAYTKFVRASPMALDPPKVTDGLDLEALFKRYASYVATIAYRILGRRDELDDVVQDVFLSAHRTLGSLRNAEAINSWLATVTVRVCQQRLRHRRLRRWLRLEAPAVTFDPPDPAASPEIRAALNDIFRALESVPVKARVAWSLRHLQGERLETIAELTGCSLAAVKRRLTKAQEILDKVIADD
jgi:RNA polymerase sigma-70 factor, ECF subfamily